jgi:hypothetical protein
MAEKKSTALGIFPPSCKARIPKEKCKGKSGGKNQSLRPSVYAPAFGRVVLRFQRVLERPKAEALGYLEATNGKGKV